MTPRRLHPDAGVTLVWQEPLTALYAKIRQDHLSGALHAIERAAPTPSEQRTLAALPTERRRIAFLAGELEHHPAAARGRLEGELERGSAGGIATQALDLLELLRPGLGLTRARAGAKAGDEALEAFDLGPLALERPSERQLPGRLLLAPRMPGTGEEPAASALELEHRGADSLEEPAVVRHQHDRGVQAPSLIHIRRCRPTTLGTSMWAPSP